LSSPYPKIRVKIARTLFNSSQRTCHLVCQQSKYSLDSWAAAFTHIKSCPSFALLSGHFSAILVCYIFHSLILYLHAFCILLHSFSKPHNSEKTYQLFNSRPPSYLSIGLVAILGRRSELRYPPTFSAKKVVPPSTLSRKSFKKYKINQNLPKIRKIAKHRLRHVKTA
jgi:hypothetical protein